jgi:group I intron endonuclease
MKLHKNRDFKKSGIYCIKNLINNKVYIGKSINIYERIRQHINLLNKESLDENRYLINSWKKYGRDSFQYYILEYLEKNEKLLKERELYWIYYYDSINKEKGYNLRIDTLTNCIVNEDTRKLQSKNRIQRYIDNPILRENVSKNFKEFWKKNPDKLKEMSKKLSQIKTKYNFYQYDKNTKELVKIWNSVLHIISENPNYKRHNIYAACSGEKPSMYGYIWVKKLINEDIVQSSKKFENTDI